MKILIVDDNKQIQNLLAHILESHEELGFADDGEKGLMQYQKSIEEEKPYDLIFLDIMMPKMDGFEMLRQLRIWEDNNSNIENKVKIAMLSSIGSPNNMLTCFEEGCDYYLVKPIIKSELTEIIDKVEEWISFMH
ncbi:MAG: response regulator [Deltaproteobacteria bacterium]|nr:response regulator [Deltaproteobacteria bacterium]